MMSFFKGCSGLIITLLGVTVLSFLMANCSIVDPAEAYARKIVLHPTEDQIAQVRTEMGLDRPLSFIPAIYTMVRQQSAWGFWSFLADQ